MYANSARREYIGRTQTNSYNTTKSTYSSDSSSYITPNLTTIKEFNHISHIGNPDKKKSTFATPFQSPYWPDNLWNDEAATLVYSYKNPEKCLGPPAHKSDQTIRFNSRFESGNLLYAYKLNPSSYHCILDNDHSSEEQCQWFYFQMSNIQIIPNSNRKMTFYISGFNKNSSILSRGSKIFMYSEKLARDKSISWVRVGTNYSIGTSFKQNSSTSTDHRGNRRKRARNKILKPKNYTLQFQIIFPYDDDVVYFCYGIPYTYTDLNTHITQWVHSFPSIITSTTLCKTLKGKNCPILTITAQHSPSKIPKKCVFVTSRNHPGEANASIILDGFIEFLFSKQPSAEYLLNHFIFKIIPMVNIDGVIDGYHHIGLDGENLNHVWGNPDSRKHPVIYHIKSLMNDVNKGAGIAAFIDFHGTSSEHGTFLYGCPFNDNDKNISFTSINKENLFPKILSSLCDSFSIEKCQNPLPRRINDPPRSVVRKTFGVINSFSIKSSFGGITDGIWENSLYNEISWKDIGAKVAESLYHLFCEKPSYLVKSIENSPSFSNSNSPKAKFNSSFDYSDSFHSLNNSNSDLLNEKKRKAEEDEKATVVAIDTGDGIKIISGSSGMNAALYSSPKATPSNYNSSSNYSPRYSPKSNSNSNSNSSVYSRPSSRLDSDSNSNPRFKFSTANSSRNRSPSPKSPQSSNRASSPASSNRSSSPKSNWNPNSDQKSNSNVRSNMNSDSSTKPNSFVRTNLNSNSEFDSSSKPIITSKYGESRSNWNSSSDSKQNSISRTNSNTRTNLSSSLSESKSNSGWSSRYNSSSSARPNITSNTNNLVSKPNTSVKNNISTKPNLYLSSESDSRTSLTSKYSSSQNRSNNYSDSRQSLTTRPTTTNPRTNSSLKSNSSSDAKQSLTSKYSSNARTSSLNSTPPKTTSSNQKPTSAPAKTANSSPRTNYGFNFESNSSSSFSARPTSSLKTSNYSYSKPANNHDSSDVSSRSNLPLDSSYSNITATEVTSSYSSLLSNSSIALTPNSSFKSRNSSSKKRVTFQIDVYQKGKPRPK
ncbi:hypothetical protein M9Y10_029425 [Tritrichomonas musculus]|uniref:Peptidase M14 domain-containing protein n=1 Tax=Tritrichomonas musculus TaxID=1915356 RepID=A0ABR2KP50_9EUKA